MVKNNRHSLHASASTSSLRSPRTLHEQRQPSIASFHRSTTPPSNGDTYSTQPQLPSRTLYEEAEKFYGDNFATYDWKPSARELHYPIPATTIHTTPIPFREHGRPITTKTNALKSPADYTQPFADFLTENPTVFHCVDHFKTKLSKAGFTEVRTMAT